MSCWLVINFNIFPKIHLGVHIVVAPGAVVTLSFPDGNQAIGGHPIVKFKQLPKYEGKKLLNV